MSRTQALLTRLRELLDDVVELGDPQLVQQVRAQVDVSLREAEPLVGSKEREAGALESMIGDSPAMQEVHALCKKFASVNASVLIRGESGTGKDLVARAIHELSPRRGDLVSENCAAIPETLLESVLFGHVRGAFTGAVRDHPGHFVSADKGTLFLDEIGDMPLAMQAKLLRVLQEGEVRPVGGSKSKKVDVRVLAATNQDLEAMVEQGSFRQDLYYRLNVLELRLPPLRERNGDVLLLARYFLTQVAGATRPELHLGATAEAALRTAGLPGNARQLQNEMHRLAALVDGPEIRAEDLSKDVLR